MASNGRKSREAVLERIRAANGDGPSSTFLPSPEAEWQGLPREYERRGQLDAAARTELFADRMADYNAGVYYTDEDGLRAMIASVLRERGKKTLVVPSGFPAEWVTEDVRVIEEKDFDTATVDDTENVITTCTVAIAATGTVVLQHGEGQGARRLSLLPDYHLCVVREGQIVETVPEAMDVLAENSTRPTTTISGPSATADIEMTRIKGVHGPRFLDVVIVK
jgi:L-lactate dehydrogenase complex protein LldG